jgi:hypothetical protein
MSASRRRGARSPAASPARRRLSSDGMSIDLEPAACAEEDEEDEAAAAQAAWDDGAAVAAAWEDERRRLLAELARRVGEANRLRASLATEATEVGQLRRESQGAAAAHAAHTAELQAEADELRDRLVQHEAEREQVERRCAELQRRAVGVTIVTQDVERRREEIAAVTKACGEVRDRLELHKPSSLRRAAARAALQVELEPLRPSELRRRAVDAGVGSDLLAGADDAEVPREALLALLLDQLAPQHEGRSKRQDEGEAVDSSLDGRSSAVWEEQRDAAHYISDGAIQGTKELFSVLVDLQARVAAPPRRRQTSEERSKNEQMASRWELEYACGRAERQREAMQLELDSERKAVASLQQQLAQLVGRSSASNRSGGSDKGGRTKRTDAPFVELEQEPLILKLQQQLAEALKRNTELFAEKDAAESKLRTLEHDDGGPTAGSQIRLLERQVAQARSQIVASEKRAAAAEQERVAMEHELAREKSRYDQLRLQVDDLVAATTNAATAVSTPWQSPRPTTRAGVVGLSGATPAAAEAAAGSAHSEQSQLPPPPPPQQQGNRTGRPTATTATAAGARAGPAAAGSPTASSYGIDEEVLELAIPPPQMAQQLPLPGTPLQQQQQQQPQRQQAAAAAAAAEGDPSSSGGSRRRLFGTARGRSSHS